MRTLNNIKPHKICLAWFTRHLKVLDVVYLCSLITLARLPFTRNMQTLIFAALITGNIVVQAALLKTPATFRWVGKLFR